MDWQAMTDKAILTALGERAARQRLNQNVTQNELVKRAGVTRIVVQRLEDGRGCTLESLLRVLRALGLLNQLDLFLPEPGPSPIQLAKLKGKERQRASGQPRMRKQGKV